MTRSFSTRWKLAIPPPPSARPAEDFKDSAERMREIDEAYFK